MEGEDVLTLVEHLLVLVGEVIDDVQRPRLTLAEELASVDVAVADVVVGIDDGQFLLQVLGSEGDVAADVAVAVGRCPGRVDVRILVGRAESTHLRLPGGVVVCLARPGRATQRA